MNGAHVHLIVNHVPIFAAFVAAMLLTVALVAPARELWVRGALIALAGENAGSREGRLSHCS